MKQILGPVVAITLITSGFGQPVDHRKEKPLVSVSSEPTGMRVYSLRTGKVFVPTLDIYRDGFISVRRYGGDEATKAVEPAAVADLLLYLKKIDWSRITEKTVEAAIDSASAKREYRTVTTDGAFWTITIRDETLSHSVRIYGVEDQAREYPEVKELKILEDAISRIYLTAEEASDGLPLPQLGKRYLHEQFAQARVRMSEPYPLNYEDTWMLFRVFEYQLESIGDDQFAAALAKEAPDVIAAVRGFIKPDILKARPHTRAVLDGSPRIRFLAERVTAKAAKRK